MNDFPNMDKFCPRLRKSTFTFIGTIWGSRSVEGLHLFDDLWRFLAKQSHLEELRNAPIRPQIFRSLAHAQRLQKLELKDITPAISMAPLCLRSRRYAQSVGRMLGSPPNTKSNGCFCTPPTAAYCLRISLITSVVGFELELWRFRFN